MAFSVLCEPVSASCQACSAAQCPHTDTHPMADNPPSSTRHALPCSMLFLDAECSSVPSLAGKNPLNPEGPSQKLAPLYNYVIFPNSLSSIFCSPCVFKVACTHLYTTLLPWPILTQSKEYRLQVLTLISLLYSRVWPLGGTMD